MPHSQEDESSSDLLDNHILRCIEMYKTDENLGEDLFSAFQGDFEGWNADVFKAADKPTIKKLRDVLFSQGVYIPKDGNSIADNLITLFNSALYTP